MCCGRSFCKECLRLWIKVQAQQGGCPRCPGGCTQKLPFRLPKHSVALRKAMEQLVPESLALRMQEAEEEPVCLGGLKAVLEIVVHRCVQAWQEVAASRDILCLGCKRETLPPYPTRLARYDAGSCIHDEP